MRLGSAYAAINEHSLALAYLLKAAQFEPKNRGLREEIEKVKQKKEAAKTKEKSLYFGMFSRS